MKRVLFLLPDVAGIRLGNPCGFASALIRRRVPVWACPIHSLGMRGCTPTVRAIHVTPELLSDPGHRSRVEQLELGDDIAWVWGRPNADQARYIFAILRAASERTRFVNDVAALVTLDSKASVYVIAPEAAIPGATVTAEFAQAQKYFVAAVDSIIAKPLIGDSGASVFVVRKEDSNAEVILQALTGDNAIKPQLYPSSIHGIQSRYAILQPFIEGLAAQEKRVIVAAGSLIAAIAKDRPLQGHRARTTGPLVEDVQQLSLAEQAVCDNAARRLTELGVNFAGLDVSGPYLVEVNIFNPGGLTRLPEALRNPAFDQACGNVLARLLNP